MESHVRRVVVVGVFVLSMFSVMAMQASAEPAPKAGSDSSSIEVEFPSRAGDFGSLGYETPVSSQQLPEYDPGGVAGDTPILNHQPVLEALARFEAENGRYLSMDLRQRLHAPLGLYHNSTLVEAQKILQAEEIPAKERLYEFDVFLRAHEGEWTLGNAGRYVTTKTLDNLKDAWIADVVTVYAPYIGVPLKLIMQANSVFSFLPGFAGGYGDDLIGYLEKEQDNERHLKVHQFLIESRKLSSDAILQRITEQRDRIKAINDELEDIPTRLRTTVMAELPSSVERLMPGFEKTWFWGYVSGEPLPPGIRAQIEGRVGGTPDWRNWVESANQHFKDVGLMSLALIQEQALLRQLNGTAEIALESKASRVLGGGSGGSASTGPESTQPAAGGYWFATSLPADWQVERNQRSAWIATVWRVIAAKSGHCPEQRAHGNISIELEDSSSVRERDELESDLYKLLESSGLYFEPDTLESYSVKGPSGEKFAGKILHSKLKYTAGFGSPTVGYRSGRANMGGYVTAIEPGKGRMIKAVYTVSAPHCWDNSGADGARAQAQAMRGQAVQILQNLVLLAEKTDSAQVAGPLAGQSVAVNNDVTAPIEIIPEPAAPPPSHASENRSPHQPAPASLGPVIGVWKINANGFAGSLTIVDAGSSISFNGGRSQEALTGVSFDGGVLKFTRPAGGAEQRFSGTLAGNRIEGTFTQKGSSKAYTWFAEIE